MTKYSCQNCNTCCISTSEQVSYCAQTSECSSPSISYSEAIGFTVLTIFLLGTALVCLYFAFKDRQLGETQQGDRECIQQEIKPSEAIAPSETKVETQKSNMKSAVTSGNLQIHSRISKNIKTKRDKTASSSKATPRSQTERGMR